MKEYRVANFNSIQSLWEAPSSQIIDIFFALDLYEPAWNDTTLKKWSELDEPTRGWLV